MEPRHAGIALALVLSACAGTGGGSSGKPDTPPAAEAEAAEPDEIGAWDACHKRGKRTEIPLDRASRRMHQTVCGAALWFDGLFGKRDLDAAMKSYGYFELATAYSEFSGSHTSLRFSAHTQLPAMQQRLSAFAGVDDEDDFARDRSEGHALRSRRRATDREAFLLGLGFAGFTGDRFQSDLKVGARHVRLPEVFVQNRFNYIPYSDELNRLVLRLTPFWNNRDRFGATTHTSLDTIIGEEFLLTWSTAVTKSEATLGVDWRSALVLYQNLHGIDALAYEAFIRGLTGAPEPLTEYGVRTVYREPILKGRMFGEVVLGYSWPREDPTLEREGSADVGIGVEMPFGKAPN